MHFKDQIVWITGASSGIGRGLALAMAKEGAQLIVSGRNAAALAEVVTHCPGATALAFEAADLDALPAIVAKAEAIGGRIDHLVNNAGIGARGPAKDTPLDIYRTVMEIDFFAPVRLTQLVLPGMLARRSGHLSVVSSLSGKFGNPGSTAYCSAKHALMGYFDSLRSEVAHLGIKVTTITPGFINTNISRAALGPDGRPLGQEPTNRGIDTDEAAQQIVAGFVAGLREIPVGRGPEMALLDLMRQNPDALFDFMANMGQQMMQQQG
jgi:short-subunit dehydrogenase